MLIIGDLTEVVWVVGWHIPPKPLLGYFPTCPASEVFVYLSTKLVLAIGIERRHSGFLKIR